MSTMQSICCYEGAGLHWTCILYKTPFRKRKNLQFINHSSGKGRLWQMVAVLGVLLEGSSPTLSSFSKHSFPSNHPPPKGWWQLEPPCLSAPPTVTFPPPLRAGSSTPVQTASPSFNVAPFPRNTTGHLVGPQACAETWRESPASSSRDSG